MPQLRLDNTYSRLRAGRYPDLLADRGRGQLVSGDGDRLCYSRKFAGWAIAEHMRTDLVADALRAAAQERNGLAGEVFHSDHGSQYTSKDFAALCDRLGVIQSMGKVGTCLLTG